MFPVTYLSTSADVDVWGMSKSSETDGTFFCQKSSADTLEELKNIFRKGLNLLQAKQHFMQSHLQHR